MAKNKTLKVLSTGTVAGMIAAAVLSSQAFAAVDAYSVKIGDDVLKYDKAALTESFLASKAGEAAPLYEDFTAKLTEAKGFYAFSDSKTGKFVSYSDIQAKFLAAKAAGEAFDVNAYTETTAAQVVEVPTFKKVVVKDGKVVVETEGQVTADLKVESVSAINVSQVEVKFNTKLNKDAAEDVDNYTILDEDEDEISGEVDFAELQADGKTVLLTVGDSGRPFELENGEVYSVKIENNLTVKKAPELDDAIITNTFKISDYAIPQVTKVESIGNKLVRVYFSKPVLLNSTIENTFEIQSDKDNFGTPGEFEGNGFDSAVYAPNYNYSAVNIELDAADELTTDTTYYLRAFGGSSDVRDAAGYKMNTVTKSFEVEQNDEVAKATSIVVNSRTEIEVTFSAPVDSTGATAEWETSSNSASTTDVEAVDDYTLKFTFETSEDEALPVEGDVEITIDDVTDRFGNDVPSKTFTVDVEGDEAATVELDDADIDFSNEETVISVEFSREVDEDDAEDEDNYVLKDASGKVVDTDLSISYNATTKIATLTYDEDLEAGTYALEVKNIVDELGIKVATTTLKVVLKDETADDLVTEAVVGHATIDGDTVIVIEYPEAMDTTTARSVLNLANYSITTAAGTTDLDDLDDDYDVDIEQINVLDNTFKITIEDYTTAITAVKVKAVNDKSGNLYETAIFNGANLSNVTLAYSINGDSLEIIDSSTIELTVDRALSELSTSDFELVLVDGVTTTTKKPSSVSFENDGLDESVITFKTGVDLEDYDSVSVRTVASVDDSKDYLGRELTSSVTSAVATSGIAPEIDTISIQDTTHIVVEFDKDMSIVRAADFKVEADGDSIDVTATAKLNSLNNVWVLTLDESIKVTDTVKVSTIAKPQSEDVDGNKLEEVSSAITAKAAFRVDSFEYDGSDIVITFNREVDEDTIDTIPTNAGLFVQGTTGNDYIDLGDLGTIDLGSQNAIVTDDDTISFTVDVDNEEVTLTLTGADTLVLNSAGYTSTYVPNETITDEDGVYIVVEDSMTALMLSGATHSTADAVVANTVIAQITAATTQTQIEAARTAYAALTVAQRALVTNEAVLQTKEQGLVDAVTLAPATTYAVGITPAGTQVAPAAQTGYTFTITGSTDASVIDNAGLTVDVGSATLTYTVTHTSSGKTAVKTMAVLVIAD